MHLPKPGFCVLLLTIVVFGNTLSQATEELTGAANSGPSATRILERTKILASDAFEGRAPGSAGEEKTVAYLIKEFKSLGLQPGNPDGTYIQNVPVVGITSNPRLTFTLDGRSIPM